MKNEDDDFGFSFTTSDAHDTKRKDDLEGLKKMIMPLLNNLMKNPEKDTIVWPNREKTIKAFIAKMDAYISDK